MRITSQHIRFLAIFFAVFFITATFLFIIDFVPEKPTTSDELTNDDFEEMAMFRELPTRVVIDAIGVDTVISNPTSTESQTLDEALLAGAVRYPGSALLGERAPVFFFGHQSYLPVVRNQAFKAFNGLQKLVSGDTILVYSETGVYEYSVESVSLVDSETALIPLKPGEQTLTLSTCNSFGDPGERYVVSARFVSRTSL